MSSSTTRFALTVAIIGGAACGSSSEAPDAPPGPGDASIDAPIDAPPDADNSACREPIEIPADPNAEAAATAALQALAPAATLTWAPVRGTVRSISGLVVQLPSCTGNINAFDQLFDVLEQTPALFQIDRTEWTAGNVPCSEILATGFHTLIIRRTKYGPYPLDNDVFAAVADVQNGTVILRNFSGTYVPTPAPAVLAKLAACPDRSHEALAAELRAQPFAYTKYAPPPAPACDPDGNGSYTAAAADALTFDPSVIARWDETDVLTIHRESSATLLVDEANHSPELLGSSANCPDENNAPRVGWIRTFDAITGGILYDHASPDPYCIVCLR